MSLSVGHHNVPLPYEAQAQSQSQFQLTSDPSLVLSPVPLGKVPHFDGSDYARWSDDMKMHPFGLKPALWTICVVGVQQSEDGIMTRELEHDMYRNAQAVCVLRGALSTYEYNKIRGLDSAKEIWDTLKMSHEGSEDVIESKIDLIQGELESFVMNKDETVDQMYNRLKLLVTEIRGLGCRDWDDAKFAKKLLRLFAPRNPMLATFVRSNPNFKTMKPSNWQTFSPIMK